MIHSQEMRRAVFHYVPLHNSPKGRELCDEVSLPITEDLSARLIRLPFYHGMTTEEQQTAIQTLTNAIRKTAATLVPHLNS